MKFSVGYQLTKDAAFMKAVERNREHIDEVYFSWGDLPNGRNPFTNNRDYMSWEAQQHLIEDLKKISGWGIKLNLLLNGNCYGANSLSRQFYMKIGDIIDYIHRRFKISTITTSSPIIAEFIKNNFEDIETRASVNMDIGTVQGMEYISKYFDGYCMQRECNRRYEQISTLKEWCDINGKKLVLLANSGCMNNCSAHVFHDNLVAHEKETEFLDKIQFKGICREYLKDYRHMASLIKDQSFVRPEDLNIYAKWFDVMKLATRVTPYPGKIIDAYAAGKYNGNILDLLEPCHSDIIYPLILDNSKFPQGFAEHILHCDKKCSLCNYCNNVLNEAIVNLDEKRELLC